MPRNGPTLVRHAAVAALAERPPRRSWLSVFRLLLLVAGLGLLGYYGYALGNQYVYQSYENWAFDQQIAGHAAVNFLDYMRQKTPLGALIGQRAEAPSAPVTKSEMHAAPPPAPGSLLGRVEIPRLNLSAMVREGVDADTLSKAVGHVPTTALAGQSGNFAIAAHRDTLFRGLKDIQKGDEVRFQSPDGVFTYRITSLRIVKPTEISVLRPDGGLAAGTLVNARFDASRPRLITLITCYPFYYVGSAPRRFIVQGQLISGSTPQQSAAVLHPSPPHKRAAPRPQHARTSAHWERPRTSRGLSSIQPVSAAKDHPPAQPKKRSIWKRLFHVS